MWKDITSYSQSDQDRIPKTWRFSTPIFSIVISCGHIDYKPGWIMHCYKIGIDTHHLPGCKSLDEAKEQAVAIVKAKTKELYDTAMAIA